MPYSIQQGDEEMWLRTEAPLTWSPKHVAQRYKTRADAQRAISRLPYAGKLTLQIVAVDDS